MPLVANLMRLYKPTGRIQVVAQWCCRESADYHLLWRWIGYDGVAHPHPDCKYWIEDASMTAQRVDESNIIRGDK